MTQNLDRRVLSKLAKIDTNGMKHTQKLDAFAKALGHKSQTAMMTAMKAKEEPQQKRTQEGLDDIVARLFDAAFRSRKDGPQDPFPREDWAYEVDCDYTSLGREDWWEAKLAQFLDDECGVDMQLRAVMSGEILQENVDYVLSGPHDVDHFDVDDILGDGYVALWNACVRDYVNLSEGERAEFVNEVGMMIRDAGAGKKRVALPGAPVWADLASDDGVIEVVSDARSYLMNVSAPDYAALRLERFAPGTASDNVFYALEKTDAGAKKLSAYLSALADRARGNDAVGFSVRFHDAAQAERWVAEHRPEIWGEPVMAEVALSTGDVCEVDVRPMLVKADADVLSGLLDGDPDTGALMKAGDETIRNSSHLVLYEDALRQARAWIHACRKDVVASLDAPYPQA